MAKTGIQAARWWGIVRQVAVGLVFTILVIVLMYWLAGGFKAKITGAAVVAPLPAAYTGQTAEVRQVSLPRTEEAVGSVRPVHEMVITSRVAARVTELALTAGQKVAKGDVLVRLDDRDLKARVEQARAAHTTAVSTRDQARIDRDRLASAIQSGAVSRFEFDRAELALKNAEAEIARTTELVNEAQAALEYGTIKAPGSGVVVDKKVNPGDTVMPGQVLATLYDPTHMQLIASVRESLTHRLKVGQEIGVRMEVLNRTCAGTVSEIVPEAEGSSRTFQVKVTGPCPPGIYSGMFGRIVIPLDAQEVLLVPAAALRKIGQLDIVDVVGANGQLQRRTVQLGRAIDTEMEVLSGLARGEKVAMRFSVPTPEGGHE